MRFVRACRNRNPLPRFVWDESGCGSYGLNLWVCSDVLGASEIYISCACQFQCSLMAVNCRVPRVRYSYVGCSPPSVVVFCFRCPGY